MNIRQYAIKIKNDSLESTILPSDYFFKDRFEKQGYYSVLLGQDGHMCYPQVHVWCEQYIGKDHYVWVGNRFWFEKEYDAAMFALKWS